MSGPKLSKLLSIPMGLTQGQFNINSFNIFEPLKSLQMRSACLLAFCYIYLKDPLEWTAEIIDKIIVQSAKLVDQNCDEMKEGGSFKCTIEVENYTANINIQEPTFLGTLKSPTSTSLFTSLQSFFRNNDFGLFRCSNLYYLIWKTNGVYYVFDARGRNDRCVLDQQNGFASLICSKFLNNVKKLIKTQSGHRLDDCFSISVVKMKRFRECGGGCVMEFQDTSIDTYTVVKSDMAILRGKFHIGNSIFKSARYRQEMAVGLMALICNKIQPSNSWTSDVVDKVILLGNKLFRECEKTALGEVTLHQLPRKYPLLGYTFKIDYEPDEDFDYLSDATKRDMFKEMKQAFKTSSTHLIQVHTLAFAVWQNNGFYYLFDPYARSEIGGMPEDKLGRPCVHMHSSLQSLFFVLFENLKTIAENEKFEFHGVTVTLECECGDTIENSNVSLSDLIKDLCWSQIDCCQEVCGVNLDEVEDIETPRDPIKILVDVTKEIEDSNFNTIDESLTKTDVISQTIAESPKETAETSQAIDEIPKETNEISKATDEILDEDDEFTASN